MHKTMVARNMAALGLMCLVVGACSPADKTDDASSAALSTAGSGVAPGSQGGFAFTLAVTFTPAAAAKLQAMGEKVTVSAMYFGTPSDAASAASKADEMGQLDMGRDAVEIAPANTTVTISGNGLQTELMPDLADGKPSVLVNVFSARKVATNNLLDCGIFEDYITVAQQTPATIACDLIDKGDGKS